MTKLKAPSDTRESLILPSTHKEFDALDINHDSQNTLIDALSTLKPVQTEFLEYVHGQESLSQLSFAVNDSAAGNKSFEDVYEQGKVLGEGGFAFVYQCQHLLNKNYYAVKECLPKKHGHGKEIRAEISALRQVKECPSFVRLLDVFDTPDKTWLIMEEMKGGDLLDKLAEIEVYEEWEARKVARTLLEAVAYCHKRKICHRDIKPENILLPRADDITLIKLADFGCAYQWKSSNADNENEMHTLCGSPQYVAPEVVGDQRPEGQGYNSQCDLWSCGVVLYIVLGGYAPFESEDEHELLDMICTADYEFHDDYWDDIELPPKRLIEQLLEVNPDQRLTAQEALQSTWLRRRDSDWVKKTKETLDESQSNSSISTFDVWLEKRNSMSMHTSNHSLPSPNKAHGSNSNHNNKDDTTEDNGDSITSFNWNEGSEEFAGDRDDGALVDGPMQDSSDAHADAFRVRDAQECAE